MFGGIVYVGHHNVCHRLREAGRAQCSLGNGSVNGLDCVQRSMTPSKTSSDVPFSAMEVNMVLVWQKVAF